MTDKQKKTGSEAEEEYLAARSAADRALAGLGEKQPFSYDPAGDALYQIYREKYTGLGKSAMEDTVGRASALTGGYSNSYAVGAGNQAYANYLKELNDIVPTLEARAYSRWKDKNSADKELYGLLSDAADQAYSRLRDEIADGRYESETAYKRSRDAAADSRAAYEYEKDLDYKYDSLLASKGYDLRTGEGRAAAEKTAGTPEAGSLPDSVPDKADTLITKLCTYLEKGQTADAARLIAAYRAMGYTAWADRMAEIYLSDPSPSSGGKEPSAAEQSAAEQSAGKQSDAERSAREKESGRTKIPVETASERNNEKVLPGSGSNAVYGAAEALKNAGSTQGTAKMFTKIDPQGSAEQGTGAAALTALIDAFEKLKKEGAKG